MPLFLLQWVSDPILINNLIIPLAGMATAVILGLPVVKALVRFVERKTGGAIDTRLHEELEELRGRVEAIEETRTRVLDLEERLDFAERMLTTSRDRPQISPEQ